MGALRHNANGALIREAVVAEINEFLQVLLELVSKKSTRYATMQLREDKDGMSYIKGPY